MAGVGWWVGGGWSVVGGRWWVVCGGWLVVDGWWWVVGSVWCVVCGGWWLVVGSIEAVLEGGLWTHFAEEAVWVAGAPHLLAAGGSIRCDFFLFTCNVPIPGLPG